MGHMGHIAPFSLSLSRVSHHAHAKTATRFYGILRRYAALWRTWCRTRLGRRDPCDPCDPSLAVKSIFLNFTRWRAAAGQGGKVKGGRQEGRTAAGEKWKPPGSDFHRGRQVSAYSFSSSPAVRSA